MKVMCRKCCACYRLDMWELGLQAMQRRKVLTNFGRPRSKLVDVFVNHR